MSLTLQIEARSRRCQARTGRVVTPNGSFEVPAFMPVGTRATIKGVLPSLVREIGAQIVLANTYHLMLRPGERIVAGQGGLHRFMNWSGPILTDSGGYQAYSMADLNTVTDDGVTFRSVVDGSRVHLSPERAIEVQNLLGADIIMAFDDCPPSVDPGAAPVNQTRLREAARRDSRGASYDHAKRLREANERTVRWLERCRDAHMGGPRAADQALFGIVQGGTDLEQRAWSVSRVCGIELPGYAIGGVAVGEEFEQIAGVVRHTAPLLPESKPRYLMGVGYERDLLAAVCAGVDMFDCVLPTRNGRNASAFTSTGAIRLRNSVHAEDGGPIEAGCDCPACAGAGGDGGSESHFSRAYIRHLFLAEEMLGPILVTLHNLRHFQRFMADLRRTIREDDWSRFVKRWPVAREGLPSALSAPVGGVGEQA
ncbi:MAG: queuine tRNA-ribosyltransferase [Phycisphaeraceae bacterium]|nr:queuine tRNA-ribosyltransferase [Phycisphaeraceae bacterium]